jgi:putative phosphoesterase
LTKDWGFDQSLTILSLQIAIISDTHMPKGGRRLPGACIRLLEASDLILHAGDLVELSVLRDLQSLGEVIAVHGNVDDADVRAALPFTRVIEFPGARIGLIHDAGPSRGRVARLERRFRDTTAVVFGHSHIPLHERSPDGFQIFNPGSPTERRRATQRTMGIAHVSDGDVNFELVPLG